MSAPPIAPVVPVPPRRVKTGSGWWRRNRWGVIALVPILAIALFQPVKQLNDDYNRLTAYRPVEAASDGWARYNGARIRLVELAPLIDLKSSNGEPYSPGPGVRAWRATVAFEATDPVGMLGACELVLEDEGGRRYKAGPFELIPARLPTVASIPNCVPPKEGNEPLPTKYEILVYFIMPISAHPVALRVSVLTSLPDYARLPAF
jgi:hypothetical protein